MDHELKTLEQYIEEAHARIDNRCRLRQANHLTEADFLNETSSLDKLDSSIKKNSAFVKKLKVFTESQKDQILNEIDRLNLSKFISEIASSIVEAKLKIGDIPAVIEVCSKLNRNYKEFSKNLLDQYAKYFPIVRRRNNDSPNQQGSSSLSNSPSNMVIKSSSRPMIDAQSNPSKIRVDLRLFSELIVSGVVPLKEGFSVLINLLYFLMVFDKNNHQNANAILTFCKGCGDEFIGVYPRSIQLLAKRHDKTLPTSDYIPAKAQDVIRNYIKDYYLSLKRHLIGLHQELEELVLKNKRVYKSRGEVTKESRELADIRHSECQKFQNIVQQLADLIGEDEPELLDFDALKEEDRDRSSDNDTLLDTFTSTTRASIWDDEGARSFYEDLLDLRTFFPNLTIKVSSKLNIATASKDDTQSKDKCFDDLDSREDLGEKRETKSSPTNSQQASRDPTPTKTPPEHGDNYDGDVNKTISSSSSEESLEARDPTSQAGTLSMVQAVANRTQPEQYYNKLSNCVNRDMIDNAAIDFIAFFNTKFGRRKLVKTLFNVQRTRLDLLPFYSRLAATLYPYVPSVGNELVSMLKHEFRSLFKKKDQINIESKVKNVRFIGELVKFDLYPKQESLNCLKMLLSDFTHHHIEMTCNLLETCGRLLYKSPDSFHQLRSLLEQMMRKKLHLSIDSKYVTMIENAYYFTNPPEVVKQVVEEPPVHMYVRYLLYEHLNRSTIDQVLQKIKKLDWSDRELTRFVINCMIEAYNLKFYSIRYLAALLAALSKEHYWISIAVIDGVVEDILLMMEINELHFNQRRIPMIRYFGELYKYRLSDSSLVFKVLYSLVTYGVHYPEPEQSLSQIPMSELDLPDNLFRIKLVCSLLDTCGQYLNSGQEKKKLDCYLLVFQRYYWLKRHIYMLHPYCMTKSGNQFPATIEYIYNDVILNLRPSFPMATSYAQASQAVRNFIDNLMVEQTENKAPQR